MIESQRSVPPADSSVTLITASLVCYKTPVDALAPLFRLLQQNTAPSIDWVVVDNAAVEQPEHAVHLAASVRSFGGRYVPSNNVGFGAAHNMALQLFETSANFHLMVNPDILFGPDVLAELVQAFHANPDAVRVMPRVDYPDGREQRLCKLLPSPLDFALRRFLPRRLRPLAQRRLDRYQLRGLPPVPSTAVPFLSGCFVFARWSVLRTIGGFDDRYFLYMEDVDLCRRMAAHGKLLYWPAVRITHGFHRGSHVSLRLMLAHLHSAWRYYNRWGWLQDAEGERINRAALESLAGATATPSRESSDGTGESAAD